jgi:hypothetical protein
MGEERLLPALITEKFAAFEQLEAEFVDSFVFVQEVQGQRRFPAFPVTLSVQYLYALWVCARKDRLLSVPGTLGRYEGQRCLELLRGWQSGESAEVVAFLQEKLDGLSLAECTRQLEAARRQGQAMALVERLVEGRLVLLHRGMNLLRALDAIFTQPEEAIQQEVGTACRERGLKPEQIEAHLREFAAPLLSHMPHPALARRNMQVMDRLGVLLTANAVDRPGARTWKVAEPTMPPGPYAQQVIQGYVVLTAPRHNNVLGRNFSDAPTILSIQQS